MFLGLNYATPLSVRSTSRAFRSESLSYKVQTSRGDAQRYELSIPLQPDNGDLKAGARLSTHRATFGLTDAFEITMPQWNSTETDIDRVAPMHTINASGTFVAGVDTIMVRAMTGMNPSNERFVIPEGRYIKFSNHTKIYQVTSTVTREAGQTVSLPIYPVLQMGISAAVTIDVDPDITVYYSEDSLEEIQITNGIIVRQTLNVVEAL